MKKSILITGIAGSGKSSVSKALNALGYQSYDIEDIDGLFKMIYKDTGRVATDFNNDNLEKVKRGDWICDKENLKEIIRKENADIAFYCGTASNVDDLISLFDKVIVLKTSPDVIKQRLSTRKPKDFGNTKEVQDWVLGWKDWLEDHIQSEGAVVIDANGSPEEISKKIIEITT